MLHFTVALNSVPCLWSREAKLSPRMLFGTQLRLILPPAPTRDSKFISGTENRSCTTPHTKAGW